jgi:hypothetical protein
MTNAQLIVRLESFHPDIEVMILDGFNGGGEPREINLGPNRRTITEKNADEGADCEGKVGRAVIVLGYGCY